MLRKYLIAAIAGAALLPLAATAAQAQGTGGELPPTGVVSAVPASTTPHLKATDDNPVEQIRQLVQCGGTMYAVGTFTSILKGSTTYTRDNIFSFSATAPPPTPAPPSTRSRSPTGTARTPTSAASSPR